MRIVTLICLIIFIVLLQSAFLNRLKIAGIGPNFALIAVVLISLAFDRKKALITGVVAGLMLDVFSSMPFGIFTLALILVSLSLNFAKHYLFTHANFAVVLAAVFLGTVFFDLFIFFLDKISFAFRFSNQMSTSNYNLLYLMPRELLYNLVAAAVIFLLWKLIRRPLAA
jgi:rod shape-determining protein MreD